MSVTQEIDRIPRPDDAGTRDGGAPSLPQELTWSGTIHEGGMGPGTPERGVDGQGRTVTSRTVAGSPWTPSRSSSWRTARSS